MNQRLWTRAGAVAVAGHLGYELLAGVSVPMASRLGIKTAVTGYAAATAALYHAAGHVPPQGAAVTAGFAFDVPVRFDTDDLTIDLAAFTAGEIPKVPLVEIVP